MRRRERRNGESGGEIERKSGGVVATGRERWHRKGGQQSLYRFEDRLQSSIVAILRNPNNLSLVQATQTSSQPLGEKFTAADFTQWPLAHITMRHQNFFLRQRTVCSRQRFASPLPATFVNQNNYVTRRIIRQSIYLFFLVSKKKYLRILHLPIQSNNVVMRNCNIKFTILTFSHACTVFTVYTCTYYKTSP